MADYYCTLDDLKSKLSDTGLRYLFDDNQDGDLTQESVFLEDCLRFTAPEIDAALCPFFDIPFDISLNVIWLARAHLDLATEWAAMRKGNECPDDIARAAATVRGWLEKVRTGQMTVPGLKYPASKFPIDAKEIGLPKVANHKRRGPAEWPH